MEPIRVCLLTDDPTRQQRWRSALAVGKVDFTLSDDPADSEPVDLVILDQPVAENLIATLAGSSSRDEVGVISVGAFESADVQLPADCSDRELRLACELLAQSMRLRRERNALKRSEQRLTRLAYTDPLTELPNRRAWERDVPNLFKTARQHGQPFCLALLDLDNFKRLNDRWGYQSGDEVLRSAGRALAENLVSQRDYAARLGGDEFGYVIAGLQPDEAREILEKARAGVAQRSSETAVPSSTASSGLACVEDCSGRTWLELFRAADNALRQAKASGRNQSVTAKVG